MEEVVCEVVLGSGKISVLKYSGLVLYTALWEERGRGEVSLIGYYAI